MVGGIKPERMNKGKNRASLAAIFALLFVVLVGFGCKMLSPGTNQGGNATSEPGSSTTSEGSGEPAEIGLCANAWYPVGPNIERRYRIKYPNNMFPEKEYSEHFGDFTADGFMATMLFDSLTTKINWRCTAEGLFATQYNNSIDMRNLGTANIDTLEASGVSFPAEDRWKTGEKWSATYRVKQTMRSGDGKVETESTGTVVQSGEIVAQETVTVPAGTFDAFKVRMATNLDMSINVNGMGAVPAKMNLETFAWFAKGKGMVKSSTDLLGKGAVVTEMMTFKE